MSGKVIIIKPDGTKSEVIHSGSGTAPLKMLQDAVEGYIERVQVRYEGRVRDGWVNEDGISKQLPPNMHSRQYLTQLPFVLGNLAIYVPDPKAKKKTARGEGGCPDCGRKGLRAGHQDCEYPDRSGSMTEVRESEGPKYRSKVLRVVRDFGGTRFYLVAITYSDAVQAASLTWSPERGKAAPFVTAEAVLAIKDAKAYGTDAWAEDVVSGTIIVPKISNAAKAVNA